MSFWDSSAIVPLCAYQQNSPAARILSRKLPEKFVWRECVVEVLSAFARLEREGLIDAAARHRFEARLIQLEADWTAVNEHERIVELARTFPVKYGLKALDSLQLATALIWCRGFPKNKDFVSADHKLLKVAGDVGFTVHDLS